VGVKEKRDGNVKVLIVCFVDRTLSLAIKDDVEDLTAMFQRHGAGMWSSQKLIEVTRADVRTRSTTPGNLQMACGS
jgi:hypothetical protein